MPVFKGKRDIMYLEGVIVSVGYDDFLAHTLVSNRSQFDRLIVVTSKSDTATKKLCEHLNVECLQTDIFYEDGAVFNKGKGINAGLDKLSRKGWVIHLDADIYLPPMTRNILERIDLDPEFIYGVDRMMCPTYEAWQNFVSNPRPIHEGWIYVHPTIFPMGVRIAEYMNTGWEPIGFFQMWNPNGSNVHKYPDEHGEADRTDVQFCKKWPRNRRALIPEIITIHLDSEDLDLKEMGKNWKGRKTKKFTFEDTVGKSEPSQEKMEEVEVPVKVYKKPWYVRLKHLFLFKD